MKYKNIALVLEELTFPKRREMSGATKAYKKLAQRHANNLFRDKDVGARTELKVKNVDGVHTASHEPARKRAFKTRDKLIKLQKAIPQSPSRLSKRRKIQFDTQTGKGYVKDPDVDRYYKKTRQV